LDDPILDLAEFLSLLATTLNDIPDPYHTPTAAIPSLPSHPPNPSIPATAPLIPHLPPLLPTHATEELNWVEVLAAPLATAADTHLVSSGKPTMDWNTVGPTFLDANAHKNEHKLNPTGIPDALRMMMHLKLFIPLSMLTTASLSQICYNDNLKFKKILFGYGASKYPLDEMHFPLEDSLIDAEYLQAHKHWLTLMRISAEPSIYGRWKCHHNRMCDNPDMLKWYRAWHSHDKQL